MGSQVLQPLEKVPFNIVIKILRHLDNNQDLERAILSHPIFEIAFHQSPRAISQSIVINKLPDGILPFALAVLVSARISPNESGRLRRLLAEFELGITQPGFAAKSLASMEFGIPDYVLLEKAHNAVQSLSLRFAKEASIILGSGPGTEPYVNISKGETFRLHRAFYRYQFMVNLFFIIPSPSWSVPEQERYEISRAFFLSFSPWVNEQLLCVYQFLECKVTKACDQIAISCCLAYDQMESYPEQDWIKEPHEIPLFQQLLVNGLPYLSSLASAEPDDQLRLIQDQRVGLGYGVLGLFQKLGHTIPDNRLIQELEIPIGEYFVSDFYESERMDLLVGLLDDPEDSTSSPFRVWLNTHFDECICQSVCNQRNDQLLWDYGYVIWDDDSVPPPQHFSEDGPEPLLSPALYTERRQFWRGLLHRREWASDARPTLNWI